MLHVLNIASFIPIDGFLPENDISLKIYANLRNSHGVKSLFVKPVIHIPFWLPFFKKSLRKRKNIIQNENYVDEKYNLKVHFFHSSFPLLNRVSINGRFLKPLEYIIYGNRLKKIVKHYKPNIVHAHCLFPDGYYALKISQEFGIPYILTIRGTYNPFYKSDIAERILSNSKAITTPSFTLYKSINSHLNIDLLPHGIDDFWYSHENKDFRTDSLKLVTVSRLLEMKNIDIVLLAIADLKENGVKVKFSIVGDGPYRYKLETLVEQLGLIDEVKFYGWLKPNHIIEVYKENEIFIMLSRPETFGRVYFEAAAQGLLVIGVKNTGPYGHFTNDEAYFIDVDKEQVKDLLLKIDNKEFTNKTLKSKKKALAYRNSTVIENYYKILTKACQ